MKDTKFYNYRCRLCNSCISYEQPVHPSGLIYVPGLVYAFSHHSCASEKDETEKSFWDLVSVSDAPIKRAVHVIYLDEEKNDEPAENTLCSFN